MGIDAVVVNASPLITLFRSAQADLLPGLFAQIIVPEAVWREVVVDEWADGEAPYHFTSPLQLMADFWAAVKGIDDE
jgi:hypothetical protein